MYHFNHATNGDYCLQVLHVSQHRVSLHFVHSMYFRFCTIPGKNNSFSLHNLTLWRMALITIIYKTSVPTWKRTEATSFKQADRLVQYSETNVMHFLFNLLRFKGLYMFRVLLAHPQEVPHKRHLVYCVCVMSVGCYQGWSETYIPKYFTVCFLWGTK
jgi:hypothetical protein